MPEDSRFLLESAELEVEDEHPDIAPGDDVPVSEPDGMSVIQVVMAYKCESEDARWERDEHNKINYDAYHSRQDNSGKVEGQSHEFLPKTPMALEQLGAFIYNGLVAYGNWFQTELRPDPGFITQPGQPPMVLTASGINRLLIHRLESAEQLAPGALDFPTLISDAIKTGALASLMVAKVHGQKVLTRKLDVDLVRVEEMGVDSETGEATVTVRREEELIFREGQVWRLVVELIRPEDYFPDPTGRGLYEIHRTRKDLYQVIEMAEAGEYDMEAVERLVESYHQSDVAADIERETDQDQSQPPDFRKEVEILEMWGSIPDSTGHIVHRNVWCAVANETFLIRRPQPNPNWSQESPFVVCPLLRVPFSVYHKALFDDAVRLNLAQNEIFNLMLDGGLAAVWGNKQVHAHLIENMDDFSSGIPQGAVFIAKPEAEQGKPVVQQIDSGTVPQESMGMFQLVDAEFQSATKINSIQLGQLPKKDVRATEIAASEQSNSMFFDTMITNVERQFIRRILRLAWLTMLQNADDWLAEDVKGCIGPEAARSLSMMSPASRYVTYGQGCTFNVTGLSTILARAREFQKIIAILGAIKELPPLMQAFMQESSPKKLLWHLYKAVNIDPEALKITEEEAAKLQETLAQLPFFSEMGGGGGGGAMQPQMMPQQQPGAPGQQAQATMDRTTAPTQEL